MDLPVARFSRGCPKLRFPIYESFAIYNQRFYLIRGDSHASSTLRSVKRILERGKLEFFFIDGGCTHKVVNMHFKMYNNLVSEGSITVFHDIVPESPESIGGAPRFWNEIKHNFEYIEFFKNWKQGGCGIGVIHT